MVELLKTELMEAKKFTLEEELKDQEDFINHQFVENDKELGFVTDDGLEFTAEIKKESLIGLRKGVRKFKTYWNPHHDFKEDQPIYCYDRGAFWYDDPIQKEIEKQIAENKFAQENWDDIFDVFSDTISRVLSWEYTEFVKKKIPFRVYPPKQQ
ncbi:hypothetical protein J4449_04595 [Candidatus Woesearchaeota archaeon]|nr:hypothetical protein [Candidatus Woesearchaeota archaeon]